MYFYLGCHTDHSLEYRVSDWLWGTTWQSHYIFRGEETKAKKTAQPPEGATAVSLRVRTLKPVSLALNPVFPSNEPYNFGQVTESLSFLMCKWDNKSHHFIELLQELNEIVCICIKPMVL